MPAHIRIGVLISETGSNLKAIIESCKDGRIKGEVLFVGSDNPEAGGLAHARAQHIPTVTVNYRSILKRYQKTDPLPPDFNLEDVLTKQTLLPKETDPEQLKRFFCSRAVAENCLFQEMSVYRLELLVLAGFMRNLTPYFIDKINTDPENPRIMNIHPALLPAFAGIDGYGDAFGYGCKVSGCTVHFIDYGEDSGPIIAQKAFAISASDTLETIRKKGLQHEWTLYPQCIAWFAEGRLKIETRTFKTAGGKTGMRKVVRVLPKG